MFGICGESLEEKQEELENEPRFTCIAEPEELPWEFLEGQTASELEENERAFKDTEREEGDKGSILDTFN